jgi:UDPglucose--hexose-1-phosphate uridylyltransferase
MPPEVAAAAKLTTEYRAKTGRSFYSDLIDEEMKTKRRVYEDKHVAVFTPYASFYHYEVWIFAKRPVDNISRLNDQEFSSFAKALFHVLTLLKKFDLSYNFFCHQIAADRNEHFCIKVEPRDSVWGGVELGSGLVINSVSPEDAADLYRQAFKK